MTISEDHRRRYPKTHRDGLVEDLHGHRVPDPYRWLENADSSLTREWVRRQSACTEEHLAALGERESVRRRLAGILRRPRAGLPIERGGRYVINRNDGTRDQDAWFVADSLTELRAGGRILLDPNVWSDDGTTSIQGVSLSRDGRTLSYAVSEGGGDWNHLRHVDLATGEALPDADVQSKGALPTWLPDGASFVYSAPRHATPMTGTESAPVGAWRLMLHRVGTQETDDEVLLSIPESPRILFHPTTVSNDGTWLVVSLADGTEASNRLWLLPLTTDAGHTRVGAPVKLIDEATATFTFVRMRGDRLVTRTDLDAERGRVIVIDVEETRRTGRLMFEELIAESENAITAVLAAGDELVTVRQATGRPRVDRHDLAGRHLGTLRTPPGVVAFYGSALWGSADRDEFFLGWSTMTHRCLTLRCTTGSDDVELLDDLIPAGGELPAAITVARFTAKSPDGTIVPYHVARRADQDAAQARPTLLYGYGGFNVPISPGYQAIFSAWLELGGVVAIASLRGGGEFGTAWYDGGRLHRKQNVFDDFIAVSEDLLSRGVTPPRGLVLHGSSNGGLLVGAVLTQRPDLAAVALPDVGVMDVLRFHRFTFGAAWMSDYGDPDDPDDFAAALAYSPLHNLSAGSYPAVLVTTGDHDDRVVPSHSYKFVAELQHVQRGEAPVLIRVETGSGHGRGKAMSQVIAETGDMIAFAAHHAGLEVR